jgi:hypothetical protein
MTHLHTHANHLHQQRLATQRTIIIIAACPHTTPHHHDDRHRS